MDENQMIEAMAHAIRAASNPPGNLRPKPMEQFTYVAQRCLDAMRPEIERRVAEARNAALEEAAAKIDQIGDQLYQEWRATRKSDQHLEGQADASDEYAEAVRALKS